MHPAPELIEARLFEWVAGVWNSSRGWQNLERRVLRGKITGADTGGRVERQEGRKDLALDAFFDGNHAADIWRDISQSRRGVAADLRPVLRERMNQRPGVHGPHQRHVAQLRS